MAIKRKYSTTEKKLSNKLSLLKSRCKNGRGLAKDVEPVVPFNLTTDWLFKQYKLQKGKCFYTDIPLNLDPRGSGGPMWDSLSFDRIDADKGYTIGNIVLASFKVNLIKNNFEIEASKIVDMLFNKKFIKQIEKAQNQSKQGKHLIKP